MIALVVLAALCSQQVLCAPPPPDMKADMDTCMQETGTTYDEIIAWADGGDASENLKCHIKCMMLLGKAMTDEGRLVLEPMLEAMPMETHAAVTECIEIEQGGELCDLAYRHNKCIRDKIPEVYGNWVRKMAMPPQ